MSAHPPYHARRKGRLFPRALGEVVQAATKPMMDKQGKIYGALLRDWANIVGPEQAAITRPQRLQWPNNEASGAILHVHVNAAHAPELHYAIPHMLEQCARYFGYRAIARMVIHATHATADTAPVKKPRATREQTPGDMADILQRLRARIATDDKRG